MNAQFNAPFDWTPETRFAIYYAPARESSWWSTGCQWLSRDPESATVLAPPTVPALAARSVDVASLSRAPQRYGWHGTLVAPTRLAPGAKPHDLLERALAWARRQHPFELPVEAAALHEFVAIRPATPHGEAAMRELASDALHELVALRAMPSDAERRRRLESDLSPRQRELLERWGYPYVLDEFRFHMTLSDSIEPDDQQVLIDWWRMQLPELGPLPIDGAALFVELKPGQPFVLAARLPFGAKQ